MPNSRQLRSSAAIISSAITSRNGRVALARRHDVIDRRERALRDSATFQPRARSMSNACGLVTSWIEVQADEQLRLPVRQLPHGVRVPDLLQKRRGHGGWY